MLDMEETRVICSQMNLIGARSKRLEATFNHWLIVSKKEAAPMPSVKQELFQLKRAAVATAASIGTPPFDHLSTLVGFAMISCPVNSSINRGGNPAAQPHPPLGRPPLRSLPRLLRLS